MRLTKKSEVCRVGSSFRIYYDVELVVCTYCIRNSLELSRYKAADGELKDSDYKQEECFLIQPDIQEFVSQKKRFGGKNSFLVCIYRE